MSTSSRDPSGGIGSGSIHYHAIHSSISLESLAAFGFGATDIIYNSKGRPLQRLHNPVVWAGDNGRSEKQLFFFPFPLTQLSTRMLNARTLSGVPHYCVPGISQRIIDETKRIAAVALLFPQVKTETKQVRESFCTSYSPNLTSIVAVLLETSASTGSVSLSA